MNEHILLVEDNPDDAALAVRALRKHRHEFDVITATSAEQALALLKDEPLAPLPRLVLLDLQLPRMSGIDLLQRLREHPRTRQLPVVVMNSSDEEKDIRAAYGAGANSYLRKPVDFADFVTLVGHLLHYWLELNRVPYDD